MLRLLSDENLNEEIVRGVLRRQRDLDVIRVRDVGLAGAKDPSILQWAADDGRILLTHDRATIPSYAYARVRHGQRMPGVFVIDDRAPVGQAIEALLLFALCSLDREWEGQVLFL